MIPAIGLSGGIIIGWLKNFGKVIFFHTNRQIAFGIITMPNSPSWILGIVYAITSVFECRVLWSQVLDVLHLNMSMILVGDFNYFL